MASKRKDPTATRHVHRGYLVKIDRDGGWVEANIYSKEGRLVQHVGSGQYTGLFTYSHLNAHADKLIDRHLAGEVSFSGSPLFGRRRYRNASGLWRIRSPVKSKAARCFCIKLTSRGPSALLLDSRGRSINAINGDRRETVASIRRAAHRHWPGIPERRAPNGRSPITKAVKAVTKPFRAVGRAIKRTLGGKRKR